MNETEFLKGFEKKALSIPLENPLLWAPLAAGGLGTLIGYAEHKLTVTEKSLRSDPDYMEKVRRNAAKSGIKPGSKELKKFENDAIKKELETGPRAEAIFQGLGSGIGTALALGALAMHDKDYGFKRGFEKKALSNPLTNPLIYGPLAVGGIGALSGYVGHKANFKEEDLRYDPDFMKEVRRDAAKEKIAPGSKELKKFENAAIKKELTDGPKREALIGGLTGGILTALALGVHHIANGGTSSRGFNSSDYDDPFEHEGYSGYQQSRSGAFSTAMAQKDLGLSGDEKTKSEVRKAFHNLARKHHPDIGGDPEKMKKINAAWEDIKNGSWFNKLAMESGFWQGFVKSANAAAELGGLGMLAIPSIQSLRGKPMKDSTKDKLEIAGLGTLAAPYVAGMAKKLVTRGH